ncbi:hypothetical protein NECAME_08194 [Necator americanus]|uniref:Uncharacterized protein n=1 Tax=Necator americanus TaxID=51031 RepID=W2TLM6_NECAM|nr:hypothetical protein NECAME_08194 [Necator americanus]ETN82041.1 hypothetical protein NECAME_08194 [Necator americanus]
MEADTKRIPKKAQLSGKILDYKRIETSSGSRIDNEIPNADDCLISATEKKFSIPGSGTAI